jgi:tRNA/rRNA methyltransferase
MTIFETTTATAQQQRRKRQRTSQQPQIRRASQSRGTLATVVVIVVVATIAMIASLLVTTVTSFSTGHNNPLYRSKATATKKLFKADQNDNGIAASSSSLVGDWIQTAIETTEAADTAATTRTTTTHSNENSSNSKNDSRMFAKINTRFVLVDTNHPGNVGSSARSIKTMGFSPEGLVVVNPHDARVLGRKKCIDACSGARDVLEHAVLVLPVTAPPPKPQDKDKDFETGNENQTNETVDNELDLESHKSGSCLTRALEQAFGEHPDGPVLVCGTGMPVDMSHQRKSQRYLEPRKFFERLLEDAERNIIDNSDNNNNNSSSSSNNNNNNITLNIAFVFGNERYGMLPEDMAFCDVVLGIPTHPSFGSLNLATAVQIIAYDWRQALGGFETPE